jgi:lipid A ethanolaminephosphotransferase
MVLAALWVASIGNLALWRGLAALPELGNARGLLFGLAFALMIGAVHVALSSLLAWRWTLKPMLTVVLLAAAAGAYFMLSYGVVIERTMMVNVLLTRARGARAAELAHARRPAPAGRAARGAAGARASPGPRRAVRRATTPSPWWRPWPWPWPPWACRFRTCRPPCATTPAALPDQPAHLFYAIATLGEQPIQRNGAAVLPLGQDAHLAPLPPASVRRWCCWWWAKPRAPTTSA